jgi:putative glutamine amidotransferase
MKPPLIGLTTYTQENKYGFPIVALMHKYISAVIEAGGVPVLIPSLINRESFATIIDKLDGFVFTGGVDLAPVSLDGNPRVKLDDVDPQRDSLEFTLVATAVEQGKPFLGICRGLQVINVAMGGALYTHLPDELPGGIKHDYDSGTERELIAHDVNIIGGTQLFKILCESRLSVNSLHHQGVRVLAPELKSSGKAPDGLIEALELPGHPFGIGVQWHPEWLMSQSSTRSLFRAFIEASGKRAGY